MNIIAKRALYFNADQTVVEVMNQNAAYLFRTAGQKISKEEIAKYKLIEGKHWHDTDKVVEVTEPVNFENGTSTEDLGDDVGEEVETEAPKKTAKKKA